MVFPTTIAFFIMFFIGQIKMARYRRGKGKALIIHWILTFVLGYLAVYYAHIAY